MGLFGKLFEKKICDICGDEIGLLGNRKLEDGNCCKNCAAKLSPWFSDRRTSTVQEIKAQLEYREANKNAVENFHVTCTLGENYKVLLDEDACKFLVTRANNYREANPDVLDYEQVTGCELDIHEDRDEVYREVKDKEGETKRISYTPRRYTYSYDFYMVIHVNHPYFDDMRFKLNDSDIEVETMGGRNMFPGSRLGYQEGSPNPPTLSERRNDVEYRKYEQMGAEIKEVLTQMRAKVRENIEEANTPKQSVICPWCGATTIPDANGCCEYCGGSLGK